MTKRIFLALACTAALLLLACPAQSKGPKEQCFETSLHHTTRGMATWYNAKGGFSDITGIPYKDLGCKNCHVTSCNDCHLQKEGDSYEYSLDKARDSETCLKCHARERATIGMDKAKGSLGVHMKAGMQCADCHSAREVHGDGNAYESMRAPGAMDASCTNCHAQDSEDYPAIPQTASHMVHNDKLDCTACHVENSMTCYNCHFGEFKKTGEKPKSMVSKAKDFMLLVKYDGKITSGTIQTLVGVDDYPFVAYVPYFTHSVTKEGRKCESCHGTKTLQAMAKGETFSPVTFKDGKLSFYDGVIPAVPDKLSWTYLKKKDDNWVPFDPPAKPMVQMAVYSEPLSEQDLQMMSFKQTYMK